MRADNGTPESLAAGDATIRPAGEVDLHAVAALHAAAFPGFFLTDLGMPFLRAYYRMVLRYEGGVFLVAENGQGLAGFVAGFVVPHVFYARMKAQRWRLLPRILLGLVARPRLLSRVLYNVARVRRTAAVVPPSGENACELSSLAVDPNRTRRGIGGALVRAFLAAAEFKQARSVFLTTDAEGNEAVRRFYEDLGFRQTRRFEMSGKRLMSEYAFAFAPHAPQDDPRSC
jgi:ribosomal protein S18 acetylase RimI-like enzyme